MISNTMCARKSGNNCADSVCTIGETLMEPDCDLIHCSVQSVRFDVIRTIDGDGSFIYCDNSDGMRFIENMFEMK